MNKIFRKQSIATEDDFNGLTEDRTFFCSELVAKGFKLAGVLKKDGVSSSRFLPSDFAEGGQSFLQEKLEDSAVIHREREIQLD